MYCAHCGANGAMKFCANCGKSQMLEPAISQANSWAERQEMLPQMPLSETQTQSPKVLRPDSIRLSTDTASMSDGLLESSPPSLVEFSKTQTTEARPDDWTMQLNYETVLSISMARARIAAAGRNASIGLTSQDLLAIFDAVSPVGVSLQKLNTALMPIYDKLGIKTLRWGQERFVASPGRVLLALLCVIARESLTVTEVEQDVDLCQMAVEIPSSLLTNPGQLFVVLQSDVSGVYLEMRTRIPGQLVDFGVSNRLIQTIITGINSDLQSQMSGSRVSILRAA